MALSGELYDYMNVRNFAFGNARKGRAALNSLAVANEAAYCEVLKVLAGIDSSQSTMAALLNDAESIKAIALSGDAAKCVAVTGRAFDVISAEGSAYRAMVAALADSLEETPWRLLSALSRLAGREIEEFGQLVGKTKTADFGKYGTLPCRVIGSFCDEDEDGGLCALTFQSDTVIEETTIGYLGHTSELTRKSAVFDYSTVIADIVCGFLPNETRETIRPARKWTYEIGGTDVKTPSEVLETCTLFAPSQMEVNQGRSSSYNQGSISDSGRNNPYKWYMGITSNELTARLKRNKKNETAAPWILRGTYYNNYSNYITTGEITADGGFLCVKSTNGGGSKNFTPCFCI